MGYLSFAKSKAGALASCSFVRSVMNLASGPILICCLDASGFVVTTAACGINVTASYPYAAVVLRVVTLTAGACYPTG
jgi:hypothetical protein